MDKLIDEHQRIAFDKVTEIVGIIYVSTQTIVHHDDGGGG